MGRRLRWWRSDGTRVGLDGSDELRDHALHARHLGLQGANAVRAATGIGSTGAGRLGILGRLFKDALDADLSAAAARWIFGAITARLLFAAGVACAVDSGDGLVDPELFFG